jgi:hypothetical protein
MFKVMCINDKWEGEPVVHGLPHPQVGDIDEVVNVIGNHYQLAAYGDNRGFVTSFFATLPDAEELKEVEQEAIVNLETA